MRQQIYRKCPSIRNHKPFTYEHKLKQRWSNYEAIAIMQYPYQKHLYTEIHKLSRWSGVRVRRPTRDASTPDTRITGQFHEILEHTGDSTS